MLKTISTALFAVSVLAAPAFAADAGKTSPAPAVKTVQGKPSVLNANAKMGDHHRHYRHHGFHKRMGALKTHRFSKVAIKHVKPAAKHG